jgi:hypothetical protein
VRIQRCISHNFKGVWRITLTTLCFFRFYVRVRKILRLTVMHMLRIIVIIALLFHLLLLLIPIFLLVFILYLIVDFMMLIDLGIHQLLLIIFVLINVNTLYNLQLLLLSLMKGVLELELFKSLFGLLLDLVLDTVDVELLLM